MPRSGALAVTAFAFVIVGIVLGGQMIESPGTVIPMTVEFLFLGGLTLALLRREPDQDLRGWLIQLVMLSLLVRVAAALVVYYAAPDLAPFAPEHLPVWIWMDEPCFYGFPVYGEPAVKVAEDVGGHETTAETRSFDPDPEGLERIHAWCESHLPGALGPQHLVKTCLYTLTPDRDFVIDFVPGHPEVVVAIGAGHAFKFASALGQVISELALEGATDADLSAFNIDRPILQRTNPPKSFYV